MRIPFTKAVREVLARDSSSVFLTGDLGYNALEELARETGPRFVNAGVAEQNMIGVAAGIALSGYRPWVYSIAPFVTYRCHEQIRNDVCLHKLPVRIVGNGGGYTYGIMGSTHHALEDIASLKALPNLQLFFPCSNNHVERAVAAMDASQLPSYLRLSISGFPRDDAPLEENPRTLTRVYRKSEAKDAVTVIAAGHAAQIALTLLADGGEAAGPLDLLGLARLPFDPRADEALMASVRRTGKVIVLEEHYAAGGVAESLAPTLAPLVREFHTMAATYSADQLYGSARFHLEQSKLTPRALAEAVEQVRRGSHEPAHA